MSKTKRAGGKNVIKEQLFRTYGHRCWLCMRKLDRRQLTLHHVIPYHVSKTTTYKDSMILCEHCHFDIVNKVKYPSKQYYRLMEEARRNANTFIHDKPPYNEEIDEPDD